MNNQNSILAVDDDPMNRMMLSSMLKKISGNKELKLFEDIASIKEDIEKNGVPVLIISDYQMPHLTENGAYFTSWLIDNDIDCFAVWTNAIDCFEEEIGSSKFKNITIFEKDNFLGLKSWVKNLCLATKKRL